SADANLALRFIGKRSRRLRGLDSQWIYHTLLWEAARLQDNRWGTRLTVGGQIPAMLPTGRSRALWDEGPLATIEHVPKNRDCPSRPSRMNCGAMGRAVGWSWTSLPTPQGASACARPSMPCS